MKSTFNIEWRKARNPPMRRKPRMIEMPAQKASTVIEFMIRDSRSWYIEGLLLLKSFSVWLFLE
jgi:hypothetical protein